jgi:hypothetical protein
MTRGEWELQGGALWEVHVEYYPRAAGRWERSPIPVADAVESRGTDASSILPGSAAAERRSLRAGAPHALGAARGAGGRAQHGETRQMLFQGIELHLCDDLPGKREGEQLHVRLEVRKHLR